MTYRVRLGVLGGTFDPIHNAHLLKAAAVARILALDHILLVPTGDPGHKARPSASGEHRYAMAALAARHELRLSVSRIEIDRPGPSYSIDTLRELRNMHGERAQLFLIMGADVFAGIGAWREHEALSELAQLIVCTRARHPLLDHGPPATRMRLPVSDLSSTMVRSRVRREMPIGHLVPTAVDSYIRERRLYQATSSSTSCTALATRSGL
jgi:nicotinate-nucleotide adenylyltransferase